MNRTAAQILADNVFAIRAQFEDSQARFATRCGISQRVVSNIEQGGEVSYSKINIVQSIAGGVGVTVAALFIDHQDRSLDSIRRAGDAMAMVGNLTPEHQRRIMEIMGDYIAMSSQSRANS